MELVVRTIVESEMTEFCRAMGVGFLRPPGDDQAEADARRASMYWDRTVAGFDGETIVSTLRSFPVAMTLPGGAELPSSAITAVSTSATHRRRGLASRMVTAELEAAKARGEGAAVLHASEWPIYGRYGFGSATRACTLLVDSSVARLRVPVAGTAEIVDVDTARLLLPPLYDAHRLRSPGELSRDARFFDIDLGLLRYPSWGPPKPGYHVVVRDPQGTVVGMTRYELEDRWEHNRPRMTVKTSLFVASEPRGTALLWQYLTDIDLVTEIRVETRPLDDGLELLLVDGRHVRQEDATDLLWIRLLDVPAALGARRYLRTGRVVLEVVDNLGLAGGRFVVEADEHGAGSCVETGETPDLTLDISTLSASCLGGRSLVTLHGAGLVEVTDRKALLTADAMFRAEVTPWCTTHF
ncbi:putative acetyltransferase [Nakamurella sp. UYEF19]|uniref:GNAT family N-acetyltransferase n=1 Tax=Nakamurella sp. UYEF19 TaxID=1756392 RepID=UPI003391B46F